MITPLLVTLGLMLGALAMTAADPDEELVRRFKRGDREAFSELVVRYQSRIFTLCLRWLGERQVAEEVSQDVFIALYRALPGFRGESRVSTWIFRVAVNHCKNRRVYLRRRHRDRHEPLEGEERLDAPARQIADDGPGTDQGVHRSEAERILSEALADMEESYRTILILRDIEGMAYDDIARVLDLRKGTVKSRLHRARSQLARVLARSIGKDDVF